MSKGSRQRPTDQQKYAEGWERAFGKVEKWRPVRLPTVEDTVSEELLEMFERQERDTGGSK